MRRTFILVVLFLLFAIGGAGAYFFDEWWSIAKNITSRSENPSTEQAKMTGDTRPSVQKNAQKDVPASRQDANKKLAEKDQDAAALAPAFDVVRVDPEGTAIFAGRAAPGSTVRVESAGEFIGKAEADQNGDWIVMRDKPIAAGKHEFSVVAIARDGGEARRSQENVKLTIGDDEAAPVKVAAKKPSAPTEPKVATEPIEKATEKLAEKPAAKLAKVTPMRTKTPGEPAKSAEAASQPVKAAEEPQNSQPIVAAKETSQAEALPNEGLPGTPAKAEPDPEAGQEAQPEAMTRVAKKETASSVIPSPALAKSAPEETADEKNTKADAAREKMEKAPDKVARSAQPDEAQPEPEVAPVVVAPIVAKAAEPFREPVEGPRREAEKQQTELSDHIVVRRGDTLWDIAERHYGAGHQYVKIYKKNRQLIRNPHLIYPTQRFQMP